MTPAISADGKMVAYASDRGSGDNLNLWLQPLTKGARAIQLTNDPADDDSPTFSPDGGQIAFVSKREPAGIYVMPALGGEERLLVKGGFEPRFSPDGKWIAYSTSGYPLDASNVFVLPVAGGSALPVAEKLGWAGDPRWSPDSKYLLVRGMDGPDARDSVEFWMIPIDGGKPIRTSIQRELGKRLAPFFRLDWSGSNLLASSGSEVWSFRLTPGDGVPSGVHRIAGGTGNVGVIQGTDSKFVVESVTQAAHLWRLPVDVASAKVTGPVQIVSGTSGAQYFPAMSRDGKVLVYLQTAATGAEIRVRNIATGKESVLISRDGRPKVSPDGSKVAFSGRSPNRGLFWMDVAGGQPTELIGGQEDVVLFGWRNDGKKLVYWHASPVRWSLFDLEFKSRVAFPIEAAKGTPGSVEFSPDEKWVAFALPKDRVGPIIVAPVRNGRAAPEAEWINITDSGGYNNRPWWSSGADILYYLSNSDRNICVWARRLHPVTKQPVGAPFAIFHAHDRKRTISSEAAIFGPAVGKDSIVFAMEDRTSNVWIGDRAAAQ